MSYKIVKPESAPEWFTPGIMCRVWDGDKDLGYDRPVVWFEHERFCFMASNGSWFRHAEPIESWEPAEGEWVAAWQAGAKSFIVTQYKNGNDGDFVTSSGYWDHIARITDGLDLRCTPEELKGRTEWR